MLSERQFCLSKSPVLRGPSRAHKEKIPAKSDVSKAPGSVSATLPILLKSEKNLILMHPPRGGSSSQFSRTTRGTLNSPSKMERRLNCGSLAPRTICGSVCGSLLFLTKLGSVPRAPPPDPQDGPLQEEQKFTSKFNCDPAISLHGPSGIFVTRSDV